MGVVSSSAFIVRESLLMRTDSSNKGIMREKASVAHARLTTNMYYTAT